MSYLSIVAWAALAAIVTVMLLSLIAGLARCSGLLQIERMAMSSIGVVVATLMVGTLILLAIASWSYLTGLL